jgi:parallel beta-helix repeat protein
MGYKIPVKASPDVIHVPTDYPTIQEAINHANSGDTIFVYNGTYYEHVVIDKSISLVGEDRHSTIIDGGGTGSVISVTANNVNINRFTIQNSGSTSSDSGIYVVSSGNNISHNTITNNKNGICLYYSNNNTVSGNNVSSNNWYGIYLHHSSNNVIFNNNIYSNYNDGIYLYYSSNNVISDNNIYSNNNGINLYYSGDNMISDNNVSNNDCGIWICQLSSNNVMSDNNIYSNKNGIYLYYSNNNVISGNDAYSNKDYGIYLQYSSSNVISNNNAYSNNLYGICLYYSSNNNTIHHNNFINNTDQVWSDSVNVWNDNNEGNYWSDYAGQDLNGNGIGDTPYIIDVNNQDNHPLMGTFSNFTVTWKGETYHVTTICNSTISNFRFEIGAETGNKIIRFNAAGKDGTVGFCRVMTPTDLTNSPFIVLVDEEETIPTLLDVSDKTHVYLYFTYIHSSHTITIISSKTLYLYNELLDKYAELLIDFDDLESTYHELLNNQSTLLSNYGQLLESYSALNLTTYELLSNYSVLLGNYSQLLESYNSLNTAYQESTGNYSQLSESYNALNLTTYELLNNYGTLLSSYSQLLERDNALNASYQEWLLNYSELQANYTSLLLEHTQNIQSLTYVFITTTTIFIIAAAYLSTHAHRKASRS